MSSLADMNLPTLCPSQEIQWGPNVQKAPGHTPAALSPCGGLGPAPARCRVNACRPRENRLCCTGSLPSSQKASRVPGRLCLGAGGGGHLAAPASFGQGREVSDGNP